MGENVYLLIAKRILRYRPDPKLPSESFRMVPKKDDIILFIPALHSSNNLPGFSLRRGFHCIILPGFHPGLWYYALSELRKAILPNHIHINPPPFFKEGWSNAGTA